MKTTVLIPVKSLDTAKSRLAKYISVDERKNLVLQMLMHVIQIIKDTPYEFDIYVVTKDREVKNFAGTLDIQSILCDIDGLNRSLTAAVKIINQADPLLVLSADLPLLTHKNIDDILKKSKTHSVVLASSKEYTGTNALLLQYPTAIPFLFGEKSLERFRQAAYENKLKVAVLHEASIAFDIDTVSDYKILQNKHNIAYQYSYNKISK